MRKHLILLATLLSVIATIKSTAQEQKMYWGVKGGICIPNLTARGAGDNPINTGYSSRLGPDIAVFAERAITNTFSLQSGIEYSSQGGKKSGLQAFPFPQEYAQLFPGGQPPEYLYANFKNEIQLNYLMLNLLAKFNWQLGVSSPLMFYGEVGPFGAYLVSAKDVTSGNSNIYSDAQMQQPLLTSPISFDNSMDIKDQAHKGNFGVTGDIGIAYNFLNSRIFIEAGGSYGLLNIQKDAANGKNQIGAVIGRVGYAFSLGSRY